MLHATVNSCLTEDFSHLSEVNTLADDKSCNLTGIELWL